MRLSSFALFSARLIITAGFTELVTADTISKDVKHDIHSLHLVIKDGIPQIYAVYLDRTKGVRSSLAKCDFNSVRQYYHRVLWYDYAPIAVIEGLSDISVVFTDGVYRRVLSEDSKGEGGHLTGIDYRLKLDYEGCTIQVHPSGQHRTYSFISQDRIVQPTPVHGLESPHLVYIKPTEYVALMNCVKGNLIKFKIRPECSQYKILVGNASPNKEKPTLGLVSTIDIISSVQVIEFDLCNQKAAERLEITLDAGQVCTQFLEAVDRIVLVIKDPLTPHKYKIRLYDCYGLLVKTIQHVGFKEGVSEKPFITVNGDTIVVIGGPGSYSIRVRVKGIQTVKFSNSFYLEIIGHRSKFYKDVIKIPGEIMGVGFMIDVGDEAWKRMDETMKLFLVAKKRLNDAKGRFNEAREKCNNAEEIMTKAETYYDSKKANYPYARLDPGGVLGKSRDRAYESYISARTIFRRTQEARKKAKASVLEVEKLAVKPRKDWNEVRRRWEKYILSVKGKTIYKTTLVCKEKQTEHLTLGSANPPGDTNQALGNEGIPKTQKQAKSDVATTEDEPFTLPSIGPAG